MKRKDVLIDFYKVFLDDIRMPTDIYPSTKNEEWLIVRNLTDFKKTIELKGVPDYISFDNDLGDSMEEGKDAAKWMVFEKELPIRNLDFMVHSANSSGVREYIESLLNNWKKELNKRKFVKGIEGVGRKFAEINKYIESGQEVPHDLSKNFIKINLIDNPFDSIE
jgi:hypothetical protein